jgi:hypothetical protein
MSDNDNDLNPPMDQASLQNQPAPEVTIDGEDTDAPFGPPTDPIDDATTDLSVRQDSGQIDPTHQATDNATDIDSQQLYDEGLAGAAEASEPNAGNAVVDYHPDENQRNQE